MKKNLILTGILVGSLCFALTGCGEKVEETTDIPDVARELIPIEEEETTTVENDVDTLDIEKIELYSDDHKMVFKNLDNSDLVFYYEGDKITGFEAYFEYSDAATAKFAASYIEKGDTVKDVYVKGKYVVVVYNESEYEDLTTESVRTVYSYLEQVQKEN
ncbi:MAG: hypothetical protein IJS47_01415 [Clostridia bacterium]|nr:hypothetical protein [Clostridia bacterium]